MPNFSSIPPPRRLGPGRRLSASKLNDVFGAVHGARGADPSVRVEMRAGGLRIGMGASGLNLSKFAFGWAGAGAAANKVRITAGYAAGFNSFISVGVDGEGEVTVGGNQAAPHFIIAQGTLEPLTGVILSTSVLASAFSGHTSNQWRLPLYRVYLRNGRAMYDLVLHVGVIDLKTWYGP